MICLRNMGVALALLFVSMALGAYAAEAPVSGLKAGAAKRSLVPPFPTTLGGFFDRTAKFTGVKTPVYARALVCANASDKFAIVTTDLISVTRELCDAARKSIREKIGIPESHILICATHNHSAPSGFTRFGTLGGPFDKPLFDFLVQEIAQAVIDADAQLKPAKLGFGSGRLDGIARNRHQNNETVVDPEVGVLRVREADSRVSIATLFNFTAHPVILGSDNLLICGEYPGMAEQTVEDVLGGVALFTQGACGDITIKRDGPPFLEVERLGRILAGEVIKTAEMIVPTPEDTVMAHLEDVAIEPRKLPSLAKAKTNFEAARKAAAAAEKAGANELEQARLTRAADSAEWVHKLVQYRKQRPGALPAPRQAVVQIAQIGPLVLVGIPGELFVEYGLEMKQRVRQTKNRPMMLVGYANDYLGYIVTPRAVHTGGYEQATARLDVSAGRVMTEAAMTKVNELVK